MRVLGDLVQDMKKQIELASSNYSGRFFALRGLLYHVRRVNIV